MIIRPLRHFKKSEFDSPDEPGSGEKMNYGFLVLLDIIREHYKKPIVVNSGFRTKEHNAAVGGAFDSSHLIGRAADIRVENDEDRAKIIFLMITLGIKRIGIGSNFLHLDTDWDKPSPRIWHYKY